MNRIKILITEDDQSLQSLYDFAIKDDFFEKKLVDSGNEALDTYKAWQPEIILLDLYLPGISGCSLLETIRKDLNDSSTVIIVSTSSDLKDDIENCSKLGVQGYIVKPFSPSEISSKLLNYYSNSSPERAKVVLELTKGK